MAGVNTDVKIQRGRVDDVRAQRRHNDLERGVDAGAVGVALAHGRQWRAEPERQRGKQRVGRLVKKAEYIVTKIDFVWYGSTCTCMC